MQLYRNIVCINRNNRKFEHRLNFLEEKNLHRSDTGLIGSAGLLVIHRRSRFQLVGLVRIRQRRLLLR